MKKFKYTGNFLLILTLEKFSKLPILICGWFKMILLGGLKKHPIFWTHGWCIYSFRSLIRFCFEFLQSIIYSFYFVFRWKFVAVLLWETIKFYLIMWWPHIENRMGITLSKSLFPDLHVSIFEHKNMLIPHTRGFIHPKRLLKKRYVISKNIEILLLVG